ncbi:MAG: heme o synthase [Oricola sp.]
MALIENIESSEARISEALPGDYFALLKPRVMSLVVFTAFVGMMLAPVAINPLTAIIAILAIAVGGGASGALNMWYDADIDAIMTRTRNRPIPAGRVTRGEALAFGLTLSVFAVLTLGTLTNWVAGGLLAFTIFFYAVIYTMWLKRSTPQNIVIGGAAGAFPPMIGWAAATGTISLESVILFLIVFLWTPPHFWALALFKLRDYDMAHVPMLPNVRGERHTKLQIVLYSLVLVAVAASPWPLGFAGPAYGAVAILLGANFLRHAWAVWRMEDGDATMVPAKKLFRFSLVYLASLFAMLLAEALFKMVFPG